jgi:hypothetical protein
LQLQKIKARTKPAQKTKVLQLMLLKVGVRLIKKWHDLNYTAVT